MVKMASTIFITSITGTIGRDLAEVALSHGWSVHGTTRDRTSPLVQSLVSRGAKVLQGTWDDEGVLKSGLEGCSHLFLNLSPDYTDFAAEERQGRTILALAADAGVSHVVYSTSLALQSDSLPFDTVPSMAVQMMRSKSILEDALKSGRYKFHHWTILRPGFFMTNFFPPIVDRIFPGLAETGTLTTAMRADTKLALVDNADIAAFAMAAFQDPRKFHGQTIAVATEIMAMPDAMKALGKALGREIKIVYMTTQEADIAQLTNPGVGMQKASVSLRQEQLVKMEDVKAWGLPLGSLEAFFNKEKETLTKIYAKN